MEADRVAICVPAVLKVLPFHTMGSSLEHTAWVTVTSYASLTDSTIVTIESQPLTVGKVTYFMAGPLKEMPFQV